MSEIDIDIQIGGVRSIVVPVTTVDLPLLQGSGELIGWSLRESTGAAVATAELTDGGNALAEIALAAGGSNTVSLGHPGLNLRSDITLHVVAGSIVGAVWARYYR